MMIQDRNSPRLLRKKEKKQVISQQASQLNFDSMTLGISISQTVTKKDISIMYVGTKGATHDHILLQRTEKHLLTAT
jgi:hypothetical protein